MGRKLILKQMHVYLLSLISAPSSWMWYSPEHPLSSGGLVLVSTPTCLKLNWSQLCSPLLLGCLSSVQVFCCAAHTAVCTPAVVLLLRQSGAEAGLVLQQDLGFSQVCKLLYCCLSGTIFGTHSL